MSGLAGAARDMTSVKFWGNGTWTLKHVGAWAVRRARQHATEAVSFGDAPAHSYILADACVHCLARLLMGVTRGPRSPRHALITAQEICALEICTHICMHKARALLHARTAPCVHCSTLACALS